jgi:hypothetical protein
MIPFEFETLTQQRNPPRISLSPFSYHLVGVFLIIIVLSTLKHFFSLSSSPSSLTMGFSLTLCLYMISLVLYLPSLYGPRLIEGDLCEETLHADLSCSGMAIGSNQSHSHKSYMSLTTSSHSQVSATEQTCEGEYERVIDNNIITQEAQAIEKSVEMTVKVSQSQEKDSLISGQLDADIELNAYQHPSGTSPVTPMVPFISFYSRHVPLEETVTMWRCYAVMFIFLCLAGSGLLVINNIQAVVQATSQEASPLFVSILSLSNASGRLIIGVFADYYAKSISRLQLLAVVSIAMSFIQFMLSFGSVWFLYPCLLCVGALFGATFANVAAITSDLFGAKYFGSNYGFIDLGPAFGSYIFSTLLIALFYPKNSPNETCHGQGCFQIPFYITSFFCFMCALLALFIHHQTPIKGTSKK